MVELRDPQKLAELSSRLKPSERADPDALVAAALEALRLSAHENAAALLDAALLSDPRSAKAWSARGMLEERQANDPGAILAYETALAIDDTDSLSALSLAQLQARAGQADRARSLVNWLILEDAVPLDVRQKAHALKRQLDAERAAL